MVHSADVAASSNDANSGLASYVDLNGVCAIGASAGGLEPLETFFASIPTTTDLAFAVIQHLSPDHESMMVSLLARHTAMPVIEAADGDQLRPNHVYLFPPDQVLTLEGNTLRLNNRDRSSTKPPSPHPIDEFFGSLAKHWGPKSAAIVLSGTGDDGSKGSEQVRRAGGLTLAQDASAAFAGMPTAAEDRGYIDAVSSVPAIAGYVVEFFSTGTRPTMETVDSTYTRVETTILADLAASTGIDFREYKRGTVRRRMEHRMNTVGDKTLADLADRIRVSSLESSDLANDILIGVTSFFRDNHVFLAAESAVEEVLLHAHAEDRAPRAWVVGCATGEEAYSIAMLFQEASDRLEIHRHVQVFATDVHEQSLVAATEGTFSEAQLEGVSDERRQRFFRRVGDAWRVSEDLRARVTFAKHNVLTDTPFSRIDLVTCRNALIYFMPTAQQRALWALGYALRQEGFLLLGTSESPGFLTPDFEPISSLSQLYRKTADGAIRAFRRRMGPELVGVPPGITTGIHSAGAAAPDQALLRAYDLILDEHLVSGLVIDSRNQVQHVIGDAKNWLEYSTGRPSLDVHALIPDAKLRLSVGALLRDLAEPENNNPQRLVEINGRQSVLTGRTIRAAGSRFSLLSARTVDVPIEVPSDIVSLLDTDDLDRITQLENDLAYTREGLQAAIEEQETSNEELNAANEELIASNEELQSSNEELSALNEELRTLNDEHHRRLQEVLELTADLEQILSTTEIGILLLDSDRNIRRFSEPSRDFFHLMASDQGRPFEHIRPRFASQEFEAAVELALSTNSVSTVRSLLEPGDEEIVIRVTPYALPHEDTGASVTVMRLGAAAVSEQELLLQAVTASSPSRTLVFNDEGICVQNSEHRFLVGEPALAVAKHYYPSDPDSVLALLEGLRDTADQPHSRVLRGTSGQRSIFGWALSISDKPHYTLLSTGVELIQSAMATWVESHTLDTVADLLGVGAAVIAPDGTIGERFSAKTSGIDAAAALDDPTNLLVLSNLVASSSELDFDQIDQEVDLLVEGTTIPARVRGLRLGQSADSPFLIIAFGPALAW